jgi:hypothetical protein
MIELLCADTDSGILGELLDADDELLVADGAYLLAEVGAAGRSMLPRALGLVCHPRQDVRYWAMSSIISCAERPIARKAIIDAGFLSDPWELTREAAARFLKKTEP